MANVMLPSRLAATIDLSTVTEGEGVGKTPPAAPLLLTTD
jgi:hypothetical protein